MSLQGPGLTVTIAGAYKRYNSWGRVVEALNLTGIKIEIRAGEVVTILGSNGSGKSTLLKAVGGLIGLDAGRIELGGMDVKSFNGGQLARWRGLLHQEPLESLCPNFSIEEMARLYLDRIDHGSEERLRARLSECGVPQKGRVGELSGGQQQLLALELVLARSPRLLLLDEPTASLDSRHASRILTRIESVGRDGVTVIMVNHNLEHCLRVSQRVAFLHEGRLVRTWNQDDLHSLRIEDLRQAFFEAVGLPYGLTSEMQAS